MIRSFLAIELDEGLRKAVASVQEQAKGKLRNAGPGVRIQWVRPEAIHLSLKFLGDIAEPLVEDLHRVVGEAVQGLSPVTVEVAGLGVFPDLRRPRILWAGLTGHQDRLRAVTDLGASVEAALAPLGFAREPRPLTPHLTLARIKEGGRLVGQVLKASGWMEQVGPIGSLVIGKVSLMKSDLKPTGAEYTRLWEVSCLG
jgi:2'-5' RNA ligase